MQLFFLVNSSDRKDKISEEISRFLKKGARWQKITEGNFQESINLRGWKRGDDREESACLCSILVFHFCFVWNRLDKALP